MKKIEDTLASLSLGQQELSTQQLEFAPQMQILTQLSEKMERISQKVSSKNPEIGETSGNRYQDQKSYATPPRARGSSNTFIPKTMKLDFPKYDGTNDLIPWLCKAER